MRPAPVSRKLPVAIAPSGCTSLASISARERREKVAEPILMGPLPNDQRYVFGLFEADGERGARSSRAAPVSPSLYLPAH